MKNISPVASTLDSLLRQSLAALANEDRLDDDIRARFHEAFDRIKRFYRATKDVVSQTVVESGVVIVATDRRRPVRCPRLLVQCMRPDTPASLALTFAYVPDGADRIALDIVHADANYRTSQFFQWTMTDGWCSEDGAEIDGESHAAAVRRALCESDLFTPSSMTLEPLHVEQGASR
ncbi:MAG: hypothetical protein JSS16_00250 [Proteobacteria bacterium]|nr:hypothetical protein [Pseudomonadota bacterium]